MVAGAVARAKVQAGVAVTGVAGPGGGSADKPVGTVWFAWSVDGQVHAECQHFDGDRTAVRRATLAHALRVLRERVAASAAPR
jgi:nicotinamide-nucleotide amidase